MAREAWHVIENTLGTHQETGHLVGVREGSILKKGSDGLFQLIGYLALNESLRQVMENESIEVQGVTIPVVAKLHDVLQISDSTVLALRL